MAEPADGELDVRYLLSTLGTTKATIAHKLSQMGIQGRRESSCYCPVAKYLEKSIIGHARCVAGLNHVLVQGYKYDVVIKTPPAVVRFIRAFDRGDFPFLEETA